MPKSLNAPQEIPKQARDSHFLWISSSIPDFFQQTKNKSFSIFYCPIVHQYSEDGHGIADTTDTYGIIVFLYLGLLIVV
jgi:hypothetical protein